MKHAPILFLLGLPSAGKTTLGRRACNELGLAFRDLAEADLKRLLRAPRAPANHRHLARMLTGVCADLNAAGQLVVMYGMLEANRLMEQFAAPPYPSNPSARSPTARLSSRATVATSTDSPAS
ncbi:MAG TPA: hypothetical protein VFT22_29440 [Kofleriaceae bacterium]|nr:hypothetical protein [Kofleriaceae bacterium]